MDKLPVEALHRIFQQVHIRQRLECTLVCRQWSQILRTRSLFQIVIIENDPMFDRFLEMIERFPLRARQVEHLELQNCPDTDFDKRKLCTIFPNLRVVKITSVANGDDANYFRNKPVEFTFPSDQIEELADHDECELAYELMASGLCSRLTTLHLNFNFEKDPFVHFISSLKNMPVLKKLTTERLEVLMEDIETLHSNLPSLEELGLSSCILKSSITPVQIEPARLVHKLTIDIQPYVTPIRRQVLWLDYISLKYPSLNDFYFWCEENEDADVDLTTFYNTLLKMTTERSIAIKLVIPLTSVVGLLLLGLLDTYCIQLRSCKIITNSQYNVRSELFISEQSKYIEDLHICGVSITTFDWLKELTKLKRLHITFDESPESDEDDEDEYKLSYGRSYNELTVLEWDELLKNCPDTLEALSIDNVKLRFKYHRQDPLTNSTIKELTLKNAERETEGLGSLVEKTLPKLRKLHFDTCFSFNEIIMMPKLDLLSLEITTDTVGEMVNLYVVTIKDSKYRVYPKKTQLFFTVKLCPDLYISHNQVEFDPGFALTHFGIYCHSVENLIVNQIAYSTC